MDKINRKVDMSEIVNERGETREAHIKRLNEASKKLAAVLAETAASYAEVDFLFEKAKERLYVTDRFPDPSV